MRIPKQLQFLHFSWCVFPRPWILCGMISGYLCEFNIAWHASFTAFPTSRVDLLKTASPFRLNTAILLWRWR